MKLETLPGVSANKAQKLSDNGIYYAEDLAFSNPARIDAINGVSAGLVAEAQRTCEIRSYKKPFDAYYTCEMCGHKIRGVTHNRSLMNMHYEGDCTDEKDEWEPEWNEVNL